MGRRTGTQPLRELINVVDNNIYPNTHYARVQLKSVDLKHVSNSGHGAFAKYRRKVREDLSSKAFNITGFSIGDTFDMFIEYNQATDAYYFRFMLKSKDISNYAIKSNEFFEQNGSARTSYTSIKIGNET